MIVCVKPLDTIFLKLHTTKKRVSPWRQLQPVSHARATGDFLSQLGGASIQVDVDVDKNSASVSTLQQILVDNAAQCAVDVHRAKLTLFSQQQPIV